MLTEAQKNANKKYFENFDDIKVRVPKGKKAEYKEYAKVKEMSLNEYIIKLIEKDMGEQ